MDLDRGWSVVAGAGWFVEFLDAIGVVAGAFDRARAGAFAAGWDEQGGDGGEQAG
jgi:hypothetical protein